MKIEFEAFPRDRQKYQEKGLTSPNPTHIITIQRSTAIPPDDRIFRLIEGPVLLYPTYAMPGPQPIILW